MNLDELAKLDDRVKAVISACNRVGNVPNNEVSVHVQKARECAQKALEEVRNYARELRKEGV